MIEERRTKPIRVPNPKSKGSPQKSLKEEGLQENFQVRFNQLF